MKEKYNRLEIIVKSIIVENGMILSTYSNKSSKRSASTMQKEGTIFFEPISEFSSDEKLETKPITTQGESKAIISQRNEWWEMVLDRQRQEEKQRQEESQRQEVESQKRKKEIQEARLKDRFYAKIILSSYVIVFGIWLTVKSGYDSRLEGYEISKGIWGIVILFLLVCFGLLIFQRAKKH